MAILKISRLGHPILFQKSKPVIDISSLNIKNIINDMSETMLDAKGIGLAAPQIHINKQIIIFRDLQEEKKGQEIKINVIINPKLTQMSDETDDKWEGCLSIPGMSGLVKRYSKIKYEGYDISGNLINGEVEGLNARVIQHEYDHLMGVLYINRLVHKNAFGYTEEIEEYWKNTQQKTDETRKN